MRTGPVVERGVRAARSTLTSSATPRASATLRSYPRSTSGSPPKTIRPRSVQLECRLPINLREFIAEQLGAVLKDSDDAVLSLAEHADEVTLSKLARAIRRYSTRRAQQSWQDCSVRLSAFVSTTVADDNPVALCLACSRIDFGREAVAAHTAPGCVSLNLSEARRLSRSPADTAVEAEVAQHLRRLVEEFRRLRAAFGLPHFKLDCYVRGDLVTFAWRPLT